MLQQLLALVLLVAGACVASPPDRILHNGKVLTVDSAFSIANAIAVQGDRILAVGADTTVRALAGPNTVLVNLQGRTVVPGLIDNHLHYLRGTRFVPHETRLDGVLTRAQALKMIAARAAVLGPGSEPGRWIFVIGGWHEQQFRDRPGGFSREELDAAAPNNPVFMQRGYSDYYLNSAAIRALAAVIGDADSSTGHLRLPGTGGSRLRNAAYRYLPHASGDAESVMHSRMREVADFNTYLNALGLTTVYDLGYRDGTHEPVERLHARGELTLRVFWPLQYTVRTPQEVPTVVERILRERPRSHGTWHGLLGLGEHVYGPLHDSTFNPGRVFPRDYYEQFHRLARAAAQRGWPIHEHAMIDSTARGLLDIGEEIAKTHPIGALRWTLAHVDLVSRDTIERAKRLGWIVAVHNQAAKPVTPGTDRPSIRMIQESGIMWGMGSDGTVVATMNPFHTLWSYTAGKVFPEIPAYREPITRAQALIAHTRSNAYLLFMENDLGTLERGKFADLVVLDRDYLTVPVDEIRDIRPVMTMVGGRIVYEHMP